MISARTTNPAISSGFQRRYNSVSNQEDYDNAQEGAQCEARKEHPLDVFQNCLETIKTSLSRQAIREIPADRISFRHGSAVM